MHHIVGIDQKGAVVRVDLSIGLKGFILAVKGQHPAVSHRANGRDPELHIRHRAGGGSTAADIGCPGTINRTIVTLGTAGTKLHHCLSPGGASDAVGLGGDQ